MKQKLLVALIGLFIIPPLGIMAVSQITRISQAHAQDQIQYEINGLDKVNSMMRVGDNDDTDNMVKMMKTYYGDNWKEGCDDMIDQLGKEAI